MNEAAAQALDILRTLRADLNGWGGVYQKHAAAYETKRMPEDGKAAQEAAINALGAIIDAVIQSRFIAHDDDLPARVVLTAIGNSIIQCAAGGSPLLFEQTIPFEGDAIASRLQQSKLFAAGAHMFLTGRALSQKEASGIVAEAMTIAGFRPRKAGKIAPSSVTQWLLEIEGNPREAADAARFKRAFDLQFSKVVGDGDAAKKLLLSFVCDIAKGARVGNLV